MIEKRENIVDEITRAGKVLEKMKEYEKSIKMHTAQIRNGLIVCCKNEDRIEQYKKLK